MRVVSSALSFNVHRSSTMTAFQIFSVLFAVSIAGVAACPGSNEYNYQVVEIPEAYLKLIGEYIIKMAKKQERDPNPDTCYELNTKFLKVQQDVQRKDAELMTGMFLKQFRKATNTVFVGVERTEKALKSDCSFNLLLQKDVQLRRYLLKNETNNEIFEAFMTEDALLEKISVEQEWARIDVVSCDHYLHHIATQYKRNVSITLVDKFASEKQLIFTMLAPIGGFYKTGCNSTNDISNDRENNQITFTTVRNMLVSMGISASLSDIESAFGVGNVTEAETSETSNE